jgi:hypothetical protein
MSLKLPSSKTILNIPAKPSAGITSYPVLVSIMALQAAQHFLAG